MSDAAAGGTGAASHPAAEELHGDPYGDPYGAGDDAHDGRVFTITGGDWDEIADSLGEAPEERIVVNMGPQHPSTHGVLRLILELEGETVTEARVGIGYLHTGIE
ncbi:MAG: NADH dehydrogenase subunit D, partial [Actinocrinis sp.]